MTCQKCGTRQILEDGELICPKCENIDFLAKEIAIKVAQAQIDWFDKGFKQVLGRFNKRRLLVWLFGYREKMANPFFKGVPRIDLGQFLSVNVLIKRVMEDYELPGDEEANEENTPELIDAFEGYIQVSERKYRIEEDFGHYVAKEDFDLKGIDKDTLMSNFKFGINEDYIHVLESFEDNLIMGKDTADIFYEKHKQDYERIQKSKPDPVEMTREETISALFPLFQSIFGALKKNKLYADTFNLKYLKEANISPSFILDFIKRFPQESGVMTRTIPREFKRVVRTKFRDKDRNVIYNNLVFSSENKGVFPFFLKIDEYIFISHNFIRQMGLFYYPFYYDELFKEEIDKNSKHFEEELVPNQLEQLGFKVKPNISDKKNQTLQIDQIAWKDKTVYVIETKVWDLKPYFEHRRIHNYRERDLKGVVDGKKYSTIDGEERIKDIPSLLSKIKYVKEHISELCADYKSIVEFKGVVVTKSYPTIKEYKNVTFLGFGNLKNLMEI